MENIEMAKKEAVEAFLHLFQALDNLDVLDDLTKAVEEKTREENHNRQSEKLKIHLFDLTLAAIQEYRETGREEAAYAIFALYEVTDKLGWLSQLEEKVKEEGLDVRFS